MNLNFKAAGNKPRKNPFYQYTMIKNLLTPAAALTTFPLRALIFFATFLFALVLQDL